MPVQGEKICPNHEKLSHHYLWAVAFCGSRSTFFVLSPHHHLPAAAPPKLIYILMATFELEVRSLIIFMSFTKMSSAFLQPFLEWLIALLCQEDSHHVDKVDKPYRSLMLMTEIFMDVFLMKILLLLL